MTKVLAGGMLVALLATPLVAQQDGISSRVSGQLGNKFTDAECQLKEGHFLVSSAKTKLSSFMSAKDEVIGARLLNEGNDLIKDAVTTKGQAKNPGAWYWQGRINLYRGDMRAADSAFTKAETLAPQCKADIQKYRQRAWSALVVGAQQLSEAKQTDSAMIMYRAANQIYGAAPHAYNGLGNIFYEQGKTDSAIVYFALAGNTDPEDAAYKGVRNKAAYNAGALLLNAKRPAEALPLLRRYHGFEPDDAQGTKALAEAFRGAGMTDSAQALEAKLVASAGQPDGGAEVSPSDLFDIGVKQFSDKNYKEAAATFGRVLAMQPWNRDALFNQANAYLALEDGASLAQTAEKLIAIEPLAEYDYTMRVQGMRMAKNQDGVYQAVVAREALPVNLEVAGMKVDADGAVLTAKVTGREPRDEANKVQPPKPVQVTVEFLDQSGAVVGTQQVEIPALKPGESQPFSATAKVAGVRGWRYRFK